jgi:hypothetical protein
MPRWLLILIGVLVVLAIMWLVGIRADLNFG